MLYTVPKYVGIRAVLLAIMLHCTQIRGYQGFLTCNNVILLTDRMFSLHARTQQMPKVVMDTFVLCEVIYRLITWLHHLLGFYALRLVDAVD